MESIYTTTMYFLHNLNGLISDDEKKIRNNDNIIFLHYFYKKLDLYQWSQKN